MLKSIYTIYCDKKIVFVLEFATRQDFMCTNTEYFYCNDVNRSIVPEIEGIVN